MKIEEFIDAYETIPVTTAALAPAESMLGKTAREIIEMASCYASDARVFLTSGDRVNAFAAAAYGLGWINAGEELGYLSADSRLLPKLFEEFPKDLVPKLEEKTLRYQRMLTQALACISIAPDKETAAWPAAEEILTLAREHLDAGAARLPSDFVNALSLFSYGYGWLDCGVRAGLFTISGDRHLFTI